MKKTGIFARAAAVVVVMALMLSVLTACTKTAVTAADFQTAATNAGLKCTDVIAQFNEYDYFKTAIVAAPEDFSYQIEFYEMSDSAHAQSLYLQNKTNFENGKSSTNVNTSVSGKNYAKYSLTDNGQYMFIEYVDSTVVYCKVDASYKDKVEAILKELKY